MVDVKREDIPEDLLKAISGIDFLLGHTDLKAVFTTRLRRELEAGNLTPQELLRDVRDLEGLDLVPALRGVILDLADEFIERKETNDDDRNSG